MPIALALPLTILVRNHHCLVLSEDAGGREQQLIGNGHRLVTMKKGTILDVNGVSYTVESQLGQGGAGMVYRVRSSVDNRTYALKQIVKDTRHERNERFRREIAFGMKASNAHVVKIHAQAEDEYCFYYTMDLYPRNLREILVEEFDYNVLLDYISQLCDGLAYVHDQGVVHRDIKPENILVDTENRRLVLADFGIAHFKDSSLTQKSDLLANRNYQAPEQMAKRDARDVGKPADIFALGLVITEVFTRQNARGTQHRRVGEVYPFLTNIDRLVERMMLQDEEQRITVQAARDHLNLIRKQVDWRIEEIMDELLPVEGWAHGDTLKKDSILRQASADILSAKHILEGTSAEELSRYNPNYHCEINYRVSEELYNACVQSLLYTRCKAKFEYEGNGGWSDSDLGFVTSPSKARLQDEFEALQAQYPVASNSLWDALPRLAAHYFRFSKDYHCEEIMNMARHELSATRAQDANLQRNLVNAPIIWIVQRVREYLQNDIFEMTPQNLQDIEFEYHVSIVWEGTDLDDSERVAIGHDLFDSLNGAERIAPILNELQDKWDVSVAEQNDGRFAIYFNSSDEYEKFSKVALAVAGQDYVFEGDVLDLLRTYDKYDDLVALIWEPVYAIPNTLAKVLGLRDI